MRRGSILALVGIVALVGRPAPADLPELQNKGILRVLVIHDPRRPEFVSLDPAAQAPGFDREIVDGFARVHRLKTEWVPVPGWDDLIPWLVEGKGDLIAGRFSETAARRVLVDFTVEVFPSRNVVVTRRPRRVVSTLEELRQERVGTVKGTSLAEAVAAAGVPRSNVDDDVPPGRLAEALRSGRVSAVVWGVEQAISNQVDDPALQIGLFVGPPGSLAYGLRKRDALLRKALNDYLAELRRSQAWSRLVVKYFGNDALEILRKARGE